MSNNITSYDYIIIGAGSAGAIVAARLTEDPKLNVLLLEAGPHDRNIWSKIPLGFVKILANPKYMWYHSSEAEPALQGRQIGLAHGKLVGGSSAVNGMIYIRGLPLDFSLWRQMGAEGWSYADVLPYFKKTERFEKGADAFHGATGPIGIENGAWKNPLADAFIEAAQSIGAARNDDFAGAKGEGAGYYHLTSWNGRRSSTGEKYIKPNRNRPNLHIITEATVTKIEFSGRKAISVVYERGGNIIRAHAKGEVILSAGALQSPQLLQLSGIGPAGLLSQYGIPVVHDLPGVGENLMDHIHAGRTYTTKSPFTVNVAMRNIFSRALAGLNYFGARNGPLSIGAAIAGAVAHTRPGLAAADVHLGLSPFLSAEDNVLKLASGSGFRMSAYQSRPESRGSVRIVSADPKAHAAIRFNYLSAENDRRTLLDALKLLRQISNSALLKKYRVTELRPGPVGDTDEGLADYIAQTASTAYHYCGTARMGTDGLAVVDASLCVHGVQNLRVIDASVMPNIVSGNTNAAVLMIGEKGADLIKAAQ